MSYTTTTSGTMGVESPVYPHRRNPPQPMVIFPLKKGCLTMPMNEGSGPIQPWQLMEADWHENIADAMNHITLVYGKFYEEDEPGPEYVGNVSAQPSGYSSSSTKYVLASKDVPTATFTTTSSGVVITPP